jgi:hypothetical protein
MRCLVLALMVTSLFLSGATAGAVDVVPSYLGKHISTPQDTRAIKQGTGSRAQGQVPHFYTSLSVGGIYS